MSNIDELKKVVGSAIIQVVEPDGHPEDDVVAFEVVNVTHNAIYTVFVNGTVHVVEETLSLDEIRKRVNVMEDYHLVVYKEEGGSERWT